MCRKVSTHIHLARQRRTKASSLFTRMNNSNNRIQKFIACSYTHAHSHTDSRPYTRVQKARCTRLCVTEERVDMFHPTSPVSYYTHVVCACMYMCEFGKICGAVQKIIENAQAAPAPNLSVCVCIWCGCFVFEDICEQPARQRTSGHDYINVGVSVCVRVSVSCLMGLSYVCAWMVCGFIRVDAHIPSALSVCL